MEEIKPTDWARIFAGDAPIAFYLELVIRAIFIYALLMFSMRMLGKRMSSQISRIEMSAMVAFASAVGVPMLSPINGLLPPVVIAIIIIVITKIIAKLSAKSQNFEKITHGDIDCLVVDSVLNTDIMERTRITRERLFAQIRSECFTHLGMIKRVYLEAKGTFTIIPAEESKPGLLVLPEFDAEFIGEKVIVTNTVICKNCGDEKPEKPSEDGTFRCLNCGSSDWTKAVMER